MAATWQLDLNMRFCKAIYQFVEISIGGTVIALGMTIATVNPTNPTFLQEPCRAHNFAVHFWLPLGDLFDLDLILI